MIALTAGLITPAACGPRHDATTNPGSGTAASSGSGAAPISDRGSAPTTCRDGDAAACVAEANAIAPQGGYRVELSKEEADAREAATVELATRGCQLGNGEGCALVARYGPSMDSDRNLERACQLGYVPSCGSVGRQLADGGLPGDRARAAELLERACDADVMDWMALTAHHGGFCRRLQELYDTDPKDPARAASAHRRACQQGDRLGCRCQTDDDCGEVPDDQSGTYYCDDQDQACALMSGD